MECDWSLTIYVGDKHEKTQKNKCLIDVERNEFLFRQLFDSRIRFSANWALNILCRCLTSLYVHKTKQVRLEIELIREFCLRF